MVEAKDPSRNKVLRSSHEMSLAVLQNRYRVGRVNLYTFVSKNSNRVVKISAPHRVQLENTYHQMGIWYVLLKHCQYVFIIYFRMTNRPPLPGRDYGYKKERRCLIHLWIQHRLHFSLMCLTTKKNGSSSRSYSQRKKLDVVLENGTVNQIYTCL